MINETLIFSMESAMITDKEVDRRIKARVTKRVKQICVQFEKDLNQKTIFYIVWSLMGILLLNVSFPKPVYYSSLSLMTIIFLYIVIISFKPLKKFLSFINNFESNIRKIVQTEIQSATQESWITNIGFWLSSRNQKDCENLAIAFSVRELLKLMKKYKIILGIRIFAYIVALFLLREVLIHIINTLLNSDS